jgi:hypothetical protein
LIERVWTTCAADATDCRQALIKAHEPAILGAPKAAASVIGAPLLGFRPPVPQAISVAFGGTPKGDRVTESWVEPLR